MVACLSRNEGTQEEQSLSLLKTQINARIAGEYWLGNVHIVYPGASLGVIEVDPLSTDADSALRSADAAMYVDKKSRRKTAFLNVD